MKQRNIKNYFRNQIKSGWREYLSIDFNYSDLGLSKEDFMTKSEMAMTLGLEPCNDYPEEGFVGEYYFYDPKKPTLEGQLEFIDITFRWSYLKNGNIWNDYDKTHWNYIDSSRGTYWNAEYRRGYRNPKLDLEDPESKYWLKDPENGYYGAEILEPIKAIAQEHYLIHDLYSGKTKIPELQEIASRCKTIYIEPRKTKINICFAILDDGYIEDCLKSLKKIFIKYKL